MGQCFGVSQVIEGNNLDVFLFEQSTGRNSSYSPVTVYCNSYFFHEANVFFENEYGIKKAGLFSPAFTYSLIIDYWLIGSLIAALGGVAMPLASSPSFFL